ncbi:MAG: hypothetical protein R2707_05375 [Acidimicrobiales bacterium]
MLTSIPSSPAEWAEVDRDDAVVGRRGSVTVIANLGGESLTIDLDRSHDLVFSSSPGAVEVGTGAVTVGPETSVYLVAP